MVSALLTSPIQASSPTWKFCPVPLLVAATVVAITFPPVTLPVTVTLVNVPTEVILGCAAVVTVPAVVAEATVPVTLAPGIDVRPAPDPLNCDPVTWPAAEINPPVSKLPDVVLPVTVSAVSVPTLVILGCAAVVTVAAVVADATVPVTLAPGILVRPAPDPKYVAAVMLPDALMRPMLTLPVPLGVSTMLALAADV